MIRSAAPESRVMDARTAKFLKLVGLAINARRVELGLSQDQVALTAGVSRSEVHHVEHGTTNEGFGTLFRICEAVHLSLGAVVDQALYILAHPGCEPACWDLKTLRGKNMRCVL